ncbi:MAG: Hsp70 family protein, partial [Candidatus Caldatribacteriaceae bacterium]
LARSQALARPEQTILRVKRRMGTGHRYCVFGRQYTPSEIGSLIFRKLKQYASSFLGEEVQKAVVTVPAYFDDNQRQGVLRAAHLGGIEVVKLLNEPTAAALAYGVSEKEKKLILVLDFGGGTFDITLMNYQEGLFEVVGTGGSTELGGSDFDAVLVRWVVEAVREERGVDLEKDPVAMYQIWSHAEKIKIDLSSVHEASIILPYLALTESGPVHVHFALSRRQFERLTAHLFQQAFALIEKTLGEASIDPAQVNVVILSGGSSRMPFFRERVCSMFPQAEIRAEVNPDEVVALGAAVHAAMLEGRLNHVELRDILPHSLGVLDDDERFVPVIERGTVYPAVVTRMFTNTQDDQDQVTVEVLQERGSELLRLGHFHFFSPKKWKKEEARLAISFIVNGNGILEVVAEDTDTGETGMLTITGGIFGVAEDGELLERRGPGIEVF